MIHSKTCRGCGAIFAPVNSLYETKCNDCMNKPIDTNTGNAGQMNFGSLTKPAPVEAVENVKHLGNLLDFIDTVDQMRTAQKSFFKLRRNGTQKEISEWLAESKRLEKEVDQYIVKFRERNSAQTKLF